MLSIVIPTLNEENYLPRLLNCIKKQNFKDYEIIVADADSKDKTIEIAKSFGCIVVKGGLPSAGKNAGARISKGNLILFLDADVLLPDNFFEDALKEFEERKLCITTFCLVPISKSRIPKILFNILYNYPLRVFEKRWAHGAMGILVKKELHKSLKGFDEEIKIGEDHYYVQQGFKFGKFGVIKSTKIFMSLRRFQTQGPIKTLLKYGLVEIYMKFFGPVRKDIFKYRFDYPKNKII
jgi:glycosyltransferase involved in cell wall biosynthesis